MYTILQVEKKTLSKVELEVHVAYTNVYIYAEQRAAPV